MLQARESLTAREREEWEQNKESMERQMSHAKEMKILELEVLKQESKWSMWIKIPLVIITMPIRILFVIPLCIYAVTKQDIPEAYWKFLK